MSSWEKINLSSTKRALLLALCVLLPILVSAFQPIRVVSTARSYHVLLMLLPSPRDRSMPPSVLSAFENTNTECHQPRSASDSALSLLGTSMDVRRFDILTNAGPMDFRGTVHEVTDDDLDWNATIFYTVKDPQVTEKLKQRFGQKPYWPDSVIREACDRAAHLPPRQYFPAPNILDFIMTNCEYKNEHADGSFTDHLSFCSEYCARYFPGASPNVLFLHSICGVNTNLFPLEVSKIPRLEPILTAHEYLHIQAFPCMLRLLFSTLMDELFDLQPAKNLRGISITAFHGAKITLEGDDFWGHLNYHLIHMLDFLPTQQYDLFATQDAFTRLFIRLHEFLRNEGKLWADVRLDRLGRVPGMSASGETLPTWDYITSRFSRDQTELNHERFCETLREYSKAIDHDMGYKLHWE